MSKASLVVLLFVVAGWGFVAGLRTGLEIWGP